MPKLIIEPHSSVVAPQGEVQLAIRPEKGRYTFALHVDQSGGRVDERGHYYAGARAGTDVVRVTSSEGEIGDISIRVEAPPIVMPEPVRIAPQGGRLPVAVTMAQASSPETRDKVLWLLIRSRTEAIGFARYQAFVNGVMCGSKDHALGGKANELSYHGVDAYQLLKRATEYFLMHECGLAYERRNVRTEDATRMGWTDADLDPAAVALRKEQYMGELLAGDNGTAIPFLANVRRRLADLPLKGPNEEPPNCYGILRHRVTDPCLLELIWSYWHEEGMLVQTMGAVSMRFQNRRAPGLEGFKRLDLSPLRPLTNLLWGYIQDEPHRLTIPRRSYEYDHHYGLTLIGKAAPPLESVDSRSRFLEAFHQLLHVTSKFYKESANTFVVPDGFPVLNAIKEVHLLLAEGMHNQYGDLPWTARSEMLIQMWLLARPEMQEFLGGRAMVPYREDWMGRVDSMRTMQSWGSTSVTHFHDLARFGESLLLSVRFGDWSNADHAAAANWAVGWRDAVQGYTHAYRAATGVDLTQEVAKVDSTLPGLLIRDRIASARSA